MFKGIHRNTLIVALIALVNMIGYGIIIPILYGYSKKFGMSDFDNGLLFSMFSICQFISTPIIGRLSDKYGRRPLLLISISGTVISFIIMAIAPNAAFLFIARAIDGLTAGNIPVALAVISDSTKPEERAKSFGFIGSAFNFGFIFGPAIAAFTNGFGQWVPFMIAAVITLVAVVLTALYLPETNKNMGEVQEGKLFDFSLLYKTLFDPNVGVTFLITLIFFLAFSCSVIYGFQPFTLNVLKITESQNAWIFTLFGVVGLLAQNLLVERTTKIWGTKKAFSRSLFLIGLAILLMAFSGNIIPFIIAAIVLAVFNSIAQTLITTIISQEADEKSQGSILGLNTSYQSIGMIFGPIIGGLIATNFSIPWVFIAGSILLFLCFFLSFKVLKPGVNKESAFRPS